jgi:hypothetical protein
MNKDAELIAEVYDRVRGVNKVRNFAHAQWEYINSSGELHREDGPAVECDSGSYAWYFHGKRHREDGPATKNVYGYKPNDAFYEYYLNDKMYTEKEFWKVQQSKKSSKHAEEVDQIP